MFNWEAAWRKAETVTFSDEVVEANGREFPAFCMDGFGSVFRFKSAGPEMVKPSPAKPEMVIFEKVGERCCFKIFRPDMTPRNIARELVDKVANGEIKKK